MGTPEGFQAALGVAALSMAVALSACNAKQDAGDRPTSGEGAATPVAVAEPAGSAVVEEARRDLAQRLNRPIEDIKVLENRRVAWKSSALGCPEPDKSYLQVVTPGWLIRLIVGRAEYRYHSSEDGPPFTCNPRQAEPPVPYSVD
jgi:hypothetical protein